MVMNKIKEYFFQRILANSLFIGMKSDHVWYPFICVIQKYVR